MNMQIFRLIAAAVSIDAKSVGVQKLTSTDILEGALNTVYFAAGATAVIIIVLAGYSFSTAVYDPAKVTQAKNSLLYAIVGLIVVITAFVITQFIMGRIK